MSLYAFQNECLDAFANAMEEVGTTSASKVKVHSISDMEKILRHFAKKIGRGTIVDFTETAHFDNFCNAYGNIKKNELFIAWYEAEDRFMEGAINCHYLAFSAAEMVLYAHKDKRKSHILLKALPLLQYPESELASSVQSDGIQTVIDKKGKEVRPLQGNEQYHVLARLCKEGHIVLHPKGSVFTREERSAYFRNTEPVVTRH